MSETKDVQTVLTHPTCSVADLCRIVGIGKNQAHQAIANGEFEALKIGKKTTRVLTAPLRRRLGLVPQDAA